MDTIYKENFHGQTDRPNNVPRPRRTVFRMQISGIPSETSWQDLKDFARQPGLDVVYSETARDRDGKGFVEFETSGDLKLAVDKLDGREFKGSRVTCTADIQTPEERPAYRDPYRRPPPPRGYSPRTHYRERSPPPIRRDDYYRDGYGRRSPPRPRIDDYPPPRRPYEDPYDTRPPPPPPRHYEDPYLAGRAYARPRSPPRADYPSYNHRSYW